MYFTFACPRCEKKLKIREELAGRHCRCPYCRHSIPVPQPPVVDDTPDDGLGDLTINTGPVAPTPSAPTGPMINTSSAAPSSAPAAGAAKPKAAPKRKPAKPKASKKHGGAGESGTDVSLFLAGVIGTIIAVAFMFAAFPFKGTYVGKMFFRGMVPGVLVLFMGCALAILLLKYQKLARQKRSMLFDLLPTDISREITVASSQDFTRHIRDLPVDQSESFLLNRVLRGLEHYWVRKSTAETATILTSQSEIDANEVDSSYTLINVFIWAIPILGFIGTVLGISGAVSGFSGDLDAASEISTLTESLKGVTSQLSTAFETTLIALVMSIFIMFPTSALRKSEEDLLNWVDEYCNENLLKRLNDGREGGAERGTGGSPKAIQSAVSQAFEPHHQELQSWMSQLKLIGETLSGHVVDGWKQVNEELDRQHANKMTELEQVDTMATNFQQTLAEMAQRAASAAQTSAEANTDTAAQLGTTLGSLKADLEEVRAGIVNLGDVLQRLGEQHVVIQTTERPRRWWWPFG